MEIRLQESKELKFAESDKAFLSLLKGDESLPELLAVLRLRAGLPIDAIKTDSKTLKSDLVHVKQIELWKGSTFLLSYYEVPESWRSTFLSLLLFGMATTPLRIDITVMKKGQVYMPLQDEAHIVIKEHTTRNQLRDYVNSHSEITLVLDALPEYKKTRSKKTIRYGKRISKLKDKGLLADEISRKIEDADYGPAEIGIYFSRYKSIVRNVLLKNPSHRVLKAIEL